MADMKDYDPYADLAASGGLPEAQGFGVDGEVRAGFKRVIDKRDALETEVDQLRATIVEQEQEIRDLKSFVIKLRGKIDPEAWRGMDELTVDNARLRATIAAHEETIARLRAVPFDCGPDGEPNGPDLGAYIDMQAERDEARAIANLLETERDEAQAEYAKRCEEARLAQKDIWRAEERAEKAEAEVERLREEKSLLRGVIVEYYQLHDAEGCDVCLLCLHAARALMRTSASNEEIAKKARLGCMYRPDHYPRCLCTGCTARALLAAAQKG